MKIYPKRTVLPKEGVIPYHLRKEPFSNHIQALLHTPPFLPFITILLWTGLMPLWFVLYNIKATKGAMEFLFPFAFKSDSPNRSVFKNHSF